MTAKRSRTGCQTCRKRKLKCDEVRPQCGQCTKSRRECVPSDGIAFRHEQNASMTGPQGLENFFKYREAFNEEQKKNFVPIPKKLTFIQIEDPYAEEQNPTHPPPSTGSYQQVAAHTLEALSTAASGHPPFVPSVSYADYNNAFGGTMQGRSGYGPAGSGPGGLQNQGNQNNNINFLLNHSGSETPANFIDPNLEIAIEQQMEPSHEQAKGSMNIGSSPVHDKSMNHKQHADEQLAALLQGVDNEMTA